MKEIKTSRAPAAAGPYSQAVSSGGLIYVSGQLATELDTGKPITDWETAAKTVFDYIEAILEAGGSSLSAVIKTTVYITDMAKFPIINAEYSRRFEAPYPARVCIGVSSLPKGSVLEIECVAKE